ncbi:MAG: PhnE/PtxC family ABC transporter permease [Dehalococcoidia bacterium]
MSSTTSVGPGIASSLRHLESRSFLTILLLGALGWSLYNVNWGQSIVHTGGGSALVDLLRTLFTPELSPSFLKVAVEATWITLAYAVAGISLAIGIGLCLGVVASGVLARPGKKRRAVMVGTRLFLAVIRSIHELVWAWFFVVAIGLSPMAGILGLAIPYGGILGRIYADILNDVRQEPLRALRGAGASEWKVLFYGRLPMALSDMLSYSFYRFECAIRAAAIMGFVGIRGLGLQIQLSLDDLLFGEMWTLLFFLIALVMSVDAWSSLLRKRLVR